MKVIGECFASVRGALALYARQINGGELVEMVSELQGKESMRTLAIGPTRAIPLPCSSLVYCLKLGRPLSKMEILVVFSFA